jgi:hypothetical protein
VAPVMLEAQQGKIPSCEPDEHRMRGAPMGGRRDRTDRGDRGGAERRGGGGRGAGGAHEGRPNAGGTRGGGGEDEEGYRQRVNERFDRLAERVERLEEEVRQLRGGGGSRGA